MKDKVTKMTGVNQVPAAKVKPDEDPAFLLLANVKMSVQNVKELREEFEEDLKQKIIKRKIFESKDGNVDENGDPIIENNSEIASSKASPMNSPNNKK